MSIIRERVKVYEMTCTSYENRVERAIRKLDGIFTVKANYSKQYVDVEYDDRQCNLKKIKISIKKAGYLTESSNDYKFIGVLIIVAAIVMLGLKTSGFDMEAKLKNASYAVLFIVGILTSIHCVGMCGGIMISQSLTIGSKNKLQAIRPSLLYNLGRVISYTILGGVIGALGSVFSLSITAQAALQILAGAFMIIMGFNMAGFSLFRIINIKLPFSICKTKNKSKSPFFVGLLNGFMPCGPLQTMQLFALGTGSALKGALSMFIFSLGTVPLMLTFGAVSGLLSKGYTKKILKLSGVLIIILGLIMGNRGFVLAGININPITAFLNDRDTISNNSDSSTNTNSAVATIEDGVQVIKMKANNSGYTPNVLYIQRNMPVKWIIDGEQINSCNNSIVVQSLNIQQKLTKGENIIEFTPKDKDINFSCWMGMIGGVIRVVDDLNAVDTSNEEDYAESSGRSSIYGNDLSVIPTEVLVKKATISNNVVSAKFEGIGYDFKPLIVTTLNNTKTKITFDLTLSDFEEGEYSIVEVKTGELITSFTGKKDINEVEISPKNTGGYAIYKDNFVLGVIEVVDNLETANLDKIRSTYLR